MIELNVLYETEDESLLGCSTDNYVIENGHQSVRTLGYSSDASHSSLSQHRLRKRARLIFDQSNFRG